jgi:hypothetical protein
MARRATHGPLLALSGITFAAIARHQQDFVVGGNIVRLLAKDLTLRRCDNIGHNFVAKICCEMYGA